MSAGRHPWLRGVVRAIHRAGLGLVAPRVRRAFREDMIATFDAASDVAERRGRWALLVLLGRELEDLAFAHRANRPAPLLDAAPGGLSCMHGGSWPQAWRSLRRRPAFLIATVVTLGLGAGIMSAVSSLVYTVLVRPLPYPDAGRLVTVLESKRSAPESTSLVAPGRLEDWQQRSHAFVALSGSYAENVTDTSGEPERLEGRRVTPRFFDVFGMAPLIGRTFTAEEERFNGPLAAVISESFWTRRFHRDPAVAGRSLTIGSRPYVIVGVMPATFTGSPIDVWLPAQIPPALLGARDARFLNGIARLRPGVTVEAATGDLAAVQDTLGEAFPDTDAGWAAALQPLKDARVGSAGRGLTLLLAAVAVLWTIGVANIAGLTLVQMRRRARELAVRAALGASRARIIGAVLREGLIVAAFGGALGACTGLWLISIFRTTLTRTPRISELTFDAFSFALAIGAALIATAACSLVPALAATRQQPATALGEGRTIAGGRHRLQRSLVAGQVALTMLLLGSAVLLLRSYQRLAEVDTGVNAAGVFTFHVGARWDEDRGRIGQLQIELLSRLEALPHVSAAGMTNFLPVSDARLRSQIVVEGVAGPNADGSVTVGTRIVSAGYFTALGASFVDGHGCPPPTTDPNRPQEALVNRRLAEQHGDGLALVGRTLRFTAYPGAFTIAGIVDDLAEDGQARTTAPYVYTCSLAGSWPDPDYVVRTADPRAFAADLRRVVREIDESRAIFGLRPMQDVLDASLAQPRSDAALIGLLAGAAVLLAAIGLYSLFMLVVAQHAREMAIRLALGASPRQIVGVVVAGAGRLLAAGVTLGLLLTVAAGRALQSAAFGLSPLDPITLAIAAAVLSAVAVAAIAVPAAKASRLDPVETLRGD